MVRNVNVIKPVNAESKFQFGELFFSKTDLVGNILTGNKVFIRVSQFSKEELIGKPHNIIRHPDMPRIVFKTLWDYLKAGKIVIAYVKNMTKEGLYYWVLAVVFPVDNGYLSIRIKPSSDYFKLIPGLYKSLSTAEEANGMNASLELLLQTLQSKGFNDYDSFMSKIIVEELNSRQKMAKELKEEAVFKLQFGTDKLTEQRSQLIKSLRDVNRDCKSINDVFIKLFQEFECLLRIKEMTDETTSLVLTFSDLISILALNSSIETYRLGEKGSTLSVISKTIKKDSEEIEMNASSVSSYSKDISSQSEQLGLLISTSRLQSDMINFFTLELLQEATVRDISAQELAEIQSNMLLLVNNFLKGFSQITNILNPLVSKIKEISVCIDLINKIIRNLERSDVLGCIEASRIGDMGTKFVIVFNQMRESTEKTRDKLVEFEKYLKSVSHTIDIINNSKETILRDVESVKLLTATLLVQAAEEQPVS